MPTFYRQGGNYVIEQTPQRQQGLPGDARSVFEMHQSAFPGIEHPPREFKTAFPLRFARTTPSYDLRPSDGLSHDLNRDVVERMPSIAYPMQLDFMGIETFGSTTTPVRIKSLDDNSPVPREIEPSRLGRIVAVPHVGGLHHCYVRRAA